MFHLALVGSRNFKRFDLIREKLNEIHAHLGQFVLVSGGAKGADSTGEKIARELGCQCVIFKPDWDRYGKSAGFLRNHSIVGKAQVVLAFWDGASRGTKHSIELAKSQNKPLWIVKPQS